MPSSSVSPTSPLVEQFQSPLNSFLAQYVGGQTGSERARMLAIMRRNALYYEGKQYLCQVFNGRNLIDYRPIQGTNTLGPTAGGTSNQVYDYVLNVMKGDIWKFVAVLGSKSPNFQAQARDAKNDQHQLRRITADRLGQYLRFHWDMDSKWRELCLILAKFGTAFGYVRYNADEARFGTTEIPQFQTIQVPMGDSIYQCQNCGNETPQTIALSLGPQPLCAACGMPQSEENLLPAPLIPALQQTGTIPYANGSVDLDITTSAAVTAPWWTGTDIKNLPWLLYQYKEDKGKLARAIPEQAEMIRNAVAAPAQTSVMDNYTQDQIQMPSGVPYVTQGNVSQVLYGRLFLAPDTYEYIPGDQNGNLRQQLFDNFKKGAMASLINNRLVRLEPRTLAAHWTNCKAQPSDSLFSPAYFDEYVQGQDVINDLWNALIEAAERSVPVTVAHPDVLDIDRLQRYSITPGEFLFTKPSAGMDISRMIHRLQAASIDPSMINFIDVYIQRLRENHGILPAIWGGADENTARQTDVNRNQALQMLNTTWNEIRAFTSRTMENAAMEMAKHCTDDTVFMVRATGAEPETIHIPGLSKLLEGGWFYETDSSIPMTAGQRRDWFMKMFELVTQNEEALKLSGLNHPENLTRFQESAGQSDWYVPGVQERIRVLDIIKQLLQGEPIMPPPPQPQVDPMTGQMLPPPPPEPPQPSIPYDATLFTPDLDMAVAQEWFMSDEGKEAQDANPAGFANFLAWVQQVKQAATPQPEPPPPPRLSFSGKLEDMTPAQEKETLGKFGIEFAGGTAGPGGPEPLPGAGPTMPPGLEAGGPQGGGPQTIQ